MTFFLRDKQTRKLATISTTPRDEDSHNVWIGYGDDENVYSTNNRINAMKVLTSTVSANNSSFECPAWSCGTFGKDFELIEYHFENAKETQYDRFIYLPDMIDHKKCIAIFSEIPSEQVIANTNKTEYDKSKFLVYSNYKILSISYMDDIFTNLVGEIILTDDSEGNPLFVHAVINEDDCARLLVSSVGDIY